MRAGETPGDREGPSCRDPRERYGRRRIEREKRLCRRRAGTEAVSLGAVARLDCALLLLSALAGVTTMAQASSWSDAATPTDGPPRAIGSAASGCLAGGVALPAEGPGFQVIRLSRHRFFAHSVTIAFVERLGRGALAAGLPPFYVGDLSQPRGGPLPFGHASHETGLDVDIWFNLDAKPPLSAAAREDPPLPSMVLPDQRAVDPVRFGERQVRLLRLAASDPAVDRLFVHWTIKRALCASASGTGAGNRAWLHRVRPWAGHDDHFHIRLACPADSPDCMRQAPIPAGDGCDASLDWWFRPHAPAAPAAKRPTPLPAACRMILGKP